MKENGKTNIDVNKLKEDFYKGALRTQFEHEVYSSGFWKGLSSTLDYVPLVGGVKNTIEACVGYSMTGEKLTTGERLLLGGLGVASVIIDVFTFGLGTGLIQGGKFVGKEVAKGMMKQVGKYAIMDITTSVTLGWTSQYASEKLRDMGLSSEEIFMVHLVASLSVMGYSKYKTNKVNINASDKETFEIITDIKGIDEASDIAKDTSKAAKNLDKIDDIGDGIKGVSKATGYGKYSTIIDDKVKVIDKVDLPEWIGESFTDGNYRTVITEQNITFYRTYGGGAKVDGSFVTTTPAGNRINAKINTALVPEWKNSRQYEAVIEVPKGTTINIGRVEKQYTKTGALLAGDGDQILLPQGWSSEWIKEIREVPSK